MQKKMVPVKQMAPINKDEAIISFSIKNAVEEYNLIDSPVKHLRPHVSVLDGQSWTDQSAADFFHTDFHTCEIADCSFTATHTEGDGST